MYNMELHFWKISSLSLINACSTLFVLVLSGSFYFYFRLVFSSDYTPAPRRGRGYTVLPLSSVRPSKIFFVAFFSVTVDGRNLIFGHKRHIGTPYRGKRFLTRQIPTSCLPKSEGIISEH